MMSKMSLIPYLEPGTGKFCLDITSSPLLAGSEAHARYPFRIMDDTGPFSRLLKARLVSGSGQSGRHLFLLVQQDAYRHEPDGIWPIGNSDLDEYWQQSFSCIGSKENRQNHFFPLEDATSPEDRLIPFHSLFFCTHRKRFFHPPCPLCGKHLELCENDELLSSKGLLPYSSTLKRYLFCPSCIAGSSDVYTYHREDADSLVVKDFHELVRSWRDISSSGQALSQVFPCTGCPEQTPCYGGTGLCEIRIVPFNFYPSYILAFQASSLNAMDFLPLISGAAFDEVIPALKEKNRYGRLDALREWQQAHAGGEMFLFDGKKEQFLEILYLKLSFLGDIARMVLSPGATPLPIDLFDIINCLWVDLPHHNGLLPALWNFKATLFTVGPCESGTNNLPASHPSQTSYCLGIIWFFTLLRNKKHPIQTIKDALNQILNRSAESIPAGSHPVFAPRNIFWDPDARKPEDIPEKWLPLWVKVISLGERLFEGNGPGNMDGSEKSVLTEITRIREEIKQHLFYEAKAAETDTHVSREAEDAEIHRILSRMLGRWQAEAPSAAPPAAPKGETLTQTVILSRNNRADFSKTIAVEVEKTIPLRLAEEEVQETVILKKGAPPLKMAETFQKAPPQEEAEEIQETVILKKNTAPPGMAEATRKSAPQEETEEIQGTVILKKNATPPGMAEPHRPTPLPGGTTAADEKNDMPETLILKPSHNKDKR